MRGSRDLEVCVSGAGVAKVGDGRVQQRGCGQVGEASEGSQTKRVRVDGAMAIGGCPHSRRRGVCACLG